MGYEKRDTDVVSISIEKHGYFQTYPGYLDLAIQKYLPASVEDLRKILAERSGGENDYSDLRYVTECLFILSEYDGNNR